MEDEDLVDSACQLALPAQPAQDPNDPVESLSQAEASGAEVFKDVMPESVEHPAATSERIIREAVERSTAVLDMADAPPKACHCTCKLGPEGQGCLVQFPVSEQEEIRFVMTVTVILQIGIIWFYIVSE